MLTFNIDGIEKKFKPAINNSKNNLELAKSNISSINIPSDFIYRSRLKSLSNNLANINTRVTNIKKWVDRSLSDFKNVESKNKNITNDLINNISQFNISSNMNNTIQDTKRSTNISKRNNTNIEGIEESEYNINDISKNIIQIIENISEFTRAVPAKEIENIHSSMFEDDILYTLSGSTEETTSDKTTYLLDDPEIQEGLMAFNSILEFQQEELSYRAEETKLNLSSSYNPEIKSFIEGFSGSFEEPSDINKMLFLLEDTVYILETINPEECNGAYDPNTDFNMCYEQFLNNLGYTKEEWEAMQEYLKQNNLTWNDIINEYKETIDILKTYNEDLKNTRLSIYQIERYIELYPYTTIPLNEDFKEYLERDYSKEGFVNPLNKVYSVIFFKPEEGRFDYLTQEEKAIYFYIKEKYSEKEAEEYYKSLKDLMNQRKAQKEVFEYIKKLDPTDLQRINNLNNFLITTGMGIEDGVVIFGENLVNLIPGNGEIMSDTQYKQTMLTMMLTQEINLEEIEKEYGKDSEEYEVYKKLSEIQPIYKKALGLNYDVASEIGESAIPMFVGFIPGWRSSSRSCFRRSR